LLGHGPATVQDFAWWAGWPVSAAREAIRAVPSGVRVESESAELWAAGEPPPLPAQETTAHLLSPFDEYLLGYKDRSRALDPAFSKRVNAGGGMPKPTVVVDGAVVGTWSHSAQTSSPSKRTSNGEARIVLALNLFRELDENEQAAVQRAARRYGAFIGASIELA
jgi:hypothetical protein